MSLDRARDLAADVEVTARALADGSPLLQAPPLDEQPWFQTLVTKVRPQLEEGRYLIVAVVGGTNIGKSAVFNHIAGEAASKIDRRAAGTKHPVLLAPAGFPTDRLPTLFPSFTLRPWTRDEDPIEADDADLLFWRTSEATPNNLLVLDTPDVDSDQEVNWDRADRIRRAADLLVCVLTQQKYNDRAIKTFFRKAAEEGKQTVVVFNQMLLPDDEDIWPEWVGGFCEETGLDPNMVYLAPHDRAAVESLSLPFFRRSWPASPDEDADRQPRRLLDELSAMHFDDIKLETMRGALEQIGRGGPRWLEAVREASRELQDASGELAEQNLTDAILWPPLPQAIMTAELMAWWRAQRQGWSQKVHGFYSRAGDLAKKPFDVFRSGKDDPIETYRQREWNEGVQRAVQQLFTKLETLHRTGHPRLQEGLADLLREESRRRLVDELKAAHDRCELRAELEELVTREMNAFRQNEPKLHGVMKNVDKATAVARPLVTIGLALTGVGIGGIAGVTAAGTMTHLVGDVVGGAAVTAAGETAVGKFGKEVSGRLQAQIQSLHDKFIADRIAWLSAAIDDWLGDFPDQIVQAAGITRSEAFRQCEAAMTAIGQFAGSISQNKIEEAT